jgi:hypothetical protein
MKKIMPFLMLLIISATSFSQQNNPAPALTKQDYLAKSKKQKTAAWILLGGGLVLTATGFAISVASADDELVSAFTTGQNSQTFVAGSFCFVIGAASTLASIPVFIASSRNKKKAMSLSFSNQRILSLQKSSYVYNSIPSLKLKISL